MATPVAKTYDWKQALRTHEQAPDRVTLYRILERLMQASIVQRYTDSARTQRFALTLRATVGLLNAITAIMLFLLSGSQPWKRPLDW